MKNQTGTTIALTETPAQAEGSPNTTTIAEAMIKANADKAADTRRSRDQAKTAKTDGTQLRKDLKRVTEARDAAMARLEIREVEMKQLTAQVTEITAAADQAVAHADEAKAQLVLWKEGQAGSVDEEALADATAKVATADLRIQALLDEVIVVTRERDEAVAEAAALRAEVDKLTATSEDLQRQTSSLQNQVSDLVPGVKFDAKSRVGQALQRLRFGLARSYKVVLLTLAVIACSPCMKIGSTWGAESFVSPVAMMAGKPVKMYTGMWWWKSHFIQVDRPILGLRYIPITVD